MNIVISGASGLVGTALTSSLSAAGHHVVSLVRRAPRSASESTWDPTAGSIDAAIVNGSDAVINLSGAGIGDKRWSDEYKRTLVSSRIDTTALLAQTIASVDQPPSVFLSASAIGVYGATGDEVLDESSPTGRGFLADLCQRWEAAAQPAAAATRVVTFRTGIVLSPTGGALKKQLPLFKFGLGGRFGNGKPWQSWISIDDEVAALTHLLTSPLSGPVNLTAPEPVTGATFATTLGKVLKRPAFLPIPRFGPSLVLGSELANALLFTGQRVVPTALTNDGYQFRHVNLEQALRSLLQR